MAKRVFSRVRSPRKRTSEFSSVSDGGMFESRPFVMESKVGEEGEKSGLKTSLNRAERYGHYLSQMQYEKHLRRSSAGLLQAAIPPIQKASGNKTKKAQQGGKTSDFGSAVSNTAADTTSNINAGVGGGTGGLLKLPMAVLDLLEAGKAIKAGKKSNAAASGVKGLAGLGESGANLAKFAGDNVSALGVGLTGGRAGTTAGLADTTKGLYNYFGKKRPAYKRIKDTARDVANKVDVNNSFNKKRNTKELRSVLEKLPTQIQVKEDKIKENEQSIGKIVADIQQNETKIKASTSEQEKSEIKENIKKLKTEQANLVKAQEGLKSEQRELEKNKDILEAALYAEGVQEKTKKREGVNTFAGVGQTVGGALAIAGAAGAGLGAIPGAAVSMSAASIKPIAWAIRKTKQFGRDKEFLGFDQNKKSTDKDRQREEVAKKLANRRGEKEMQEIFKNLPGVSKEEIRRFSEPNQTDQMPVDEIKNILKRRNY